MTPPMIEWDAGARASRPFRNLLLKLVARFEHRARHWGCLADGLVAGAQISLTPWLFTLSGIADPFLTSTVCWVSP